MAWTEHIPKKLIVPVIKAYVWSKPQIGGLVYEWGIINPDEKTTTIYFSNISRDGEINPEIERLPEITLPGEIIRPGETLREILAGL
jgi:hypothetical protein